MALFQGLDREGRILEKVDRLSRAGYTALEAESEIRAATAFIKALGLLEAEEPQARIEDLSRRTRRSGKVSCASAASNRRRLPRPRR